MKNTVVRLRQWAGPGKQWAQAHFLFGLNRIRKSSIKGHSTRGFISCRTKVRDGFGRLAQVTCSMSIKFGPWGSAWRL
ncbi:MAG TPA: hypothetical protein VGG42_07355, partial [Acidobacteriaceae bacterium]